MKPMLSITRKEVNSYFSSPLALIFVAVFLAATLVTFFLLDKFFTRNIADVRSLFRSMPILMIFLVAALTMRQWSEEEQEGTLEILFTMPLKLYQLVLGKFLAVLTLVAVALALTVFLPLTISQFGNLDYGPIIGGYLAAILMVSAYIAIGLFVSSRTGNQIVALIITVLVCGFFLGIGRPEFTNLFNSSKTAQILRAFGTGSRFESIERGVIDLRDLVYYLSLTVIFLALNVLSLDRKRWGTGASTQSYRLNLQTGVSLLAINLILLNGILFPLNRARLDLTENKDYSLSDVTRDILSNLQEPLLIRGYFSDKNHPLLSPLIPTVEDMLQEYKIAGGDKVQVETLDPVKDPEKEAEANQTYGIRPEPVQISDLYGTSVLNIYFDILIRYGDQTATLNFQDLIAVDQFGNGDLNVHLRNLEYDLTSNIKRLVLGFQSVDAVLASLAEPAQLTLYYTPGTLPENLADAPDTIQTVAQDITDISNGKFSYTAVDLDDPAQATNATALLDQYGIQPLAVDFFGQQTYYMHMLLQSGTKVILIYPPSAVSENEMRSNIEGALQRLSSGFLKVVGIWTPPDTPQQDPFGQQIPPLQVFQTLQDALRKDYEIQTIDLSTGQVPNNIDVLMVIAPENLTDVDRYAVDQYLMRGGTVFVAAGNFMLAQDPFSGTLTVIPVQSGLQEMLASYGVTVEHSLVMDTQNDSFINQVTRNVGGVPVSEVQAFDFPAFVDVRPDGMDRKSPILSSLPAISLNWVSPLTLDPDKNEGRKVTTLLKSSTTSWMTTSTSIEPNFDIYPNVGFPVEGERKSQPLAVIVEGTFDSFFTGKESPFVEPIDTTQTDPNAPPPAPVPAPPPGGLIETSSDTARLIVVGSFEFLNDNILQLSANLGGDAYLNTVQFVQNTVDWATQDTDLLSIRSRGSSARLLDPLEEGRERFWELLNYALAIISVVLLGMLWQWRKRTEPPMELVGVGGMQTGETLDEQPE